MPWVEVFAVFVVCHLCGDFLLQTDWQARNKRGGLGGDRVARRALLSHVSVYTLAFVPALAWLAGDIGAGAIAIGAVIFLTHLLQDDGRLLGSYVSAVKGPGANRNSSVVFDVDQSLHLLVLFAIALWAGN